MEFDTIYGYIKIDRDYSKSVDFIKSLGKDESYPFVNTNMFSFGDYEIPYFYENPIFGFAATYKNFGYDLSDWNDFILKIENILRNIDFDNAQFHVFSSIGDFTLFWRKRGSSLLGEENDRKYIAKYSLTKTPEWYFGFGRRSPFTGYTNPNKIDPYEDLRNDPDFGFVYPVPKVS
ncbi:hypothetical protein [Mucilaginibacter endophyticus]|uniref:hypothetical protein n=1 Tax=Mucilaginibacter endophyticus TaxID=2675003 RepID=UPI000E0D706F|nr:hypothetical protein [Mucilaginibacter endophyticus]